MARFFAVTCMVFIIGFQLIWLRADYKNRKAQLLSRAETVLQEQLIELQVQQIAGSVTLTNRDSSITFDLNKLVKGAADTTQREEYLLQKGAYNAADVAIRIPLRKKDTTVPQSRLLYERLRSKKDFRERNRNFAVIGWIKDKQYPYPANAVNKESSEVTDIIVPETQRGVAYQLRFSNLWPSIIADMKGSLLLSLIYLLLSVATLAILMQSLARSRKLMAMKTGFTYNMTHELKIPVSTLYAAIEALDRYDMVHDAEASRRYIRLMKDDVNRLSGMIDSILTNARLEEGKIPLQLACIPIKTIIQTAQQVLSLQLQIKGATISTSGIPDGTEIYADKELIGNVFINLIDNTLKYHASGSPVIYIATYLSKGNLAIAFADNGPGIPQQYWQEIFEPYFRVPEADLHSTKGYGLGLSYAREIIHLHGGTIAVADSSEAGTTFRITLPLCHG